MRINDIVVPKTSEPQQKTGKRKIFVKPLEADRVEFTKKLLKTDLLFSLGSRIGKAMQAAKNNDSKLTEPAKQAEKYPKTTFEKLFEDGALSYEPLFECLHNTDLEEYRLGVPLKYKRKDFIEDFKNEIKGLSELEQHAVFKHFNFLIDERSDMINCPIPNDEIPEHLSKEAQAAIKNCQNLINDFLFNNSVAMPENKEFEKTMNAVLKTFPELTTIIGKKEHKLESLDYHTLKVLQIALENPETKELTKQEQRMLTIAVLFHDFAKREGVVDRLHPQKSAEYAKTVFAKLDLSEEEKERTYNLINHSHWLGDYNKGKATLDEIAAAFIKGNDFKIAKIIGDADINSSNLTIQLFGKALKAAPYELIEARIDELRKNTYTDSYSDVS